MSKRMKHSKTVKIRFTNPEYQAVKITAYKITHFVKYGIIFNSGRFQKMWNKKSKGRLHAMYNVIIKIVNDDYTNNSSIENMINYIYRTKNCKSKQTEALPIHA